MLPQHSFALEPKLLIQSNRCFVVRVNLQLEPREIQPLVRQINAGLHQRFSHTFPLPRFTDTDPDDAGMASTRFVRESIDREHPDHVLATDGDEAVTTLHFRDALAPVFARRIWRL